MILSQSFLKLAGVQVIPVGRTAGAEIAGEFGRGACVTVRMLVLAAG
jgi:hypothetical protein